MYFIVDKMVYFKFLLQRINISFQSYYQTIGLKTLPVILNKHSTGAEEAGTAGIVSATLDKIVFLTNTTLSG